MSMKTVDNALCRLLETNRDIVSGKECYAFFNALSAAEIGRNLRGVSKTLSLCTTKNM